MRSTQGFCDAMAEAFLIKHDRFGWRSMQPLIVPVIKK
jgi:hypothetical protein